MVPRPHSLFRGSDQEQDHRQDVRAPVINRMNQTFSAVANHKPVWLHPDIHETLGIICEDLHISEEGTHQDNLSPVFFEPLGTRHVPPPHPTAAETPTHAQKILDEWDRPTPRPPTVTDQLYLLMYRINVIFDTSPRDFEKDRGWSNTLSDYAKWFICGEITPELIAEEFDGLVWGPHASMPNVGFTARPRLNKPHILLALLTRSEANEMLCRSEALTILIVMLTRLERDELPNHNVIPMMVISVFPGFKLRILEAHYDARGLVIRKSDFLGFANRDAAMQNMDTLMSFMGSKMIGNTMVPNLMAEPETEVPPPPDDNSGQETNSRGLKFWRVGFLWRALRLMLKTHMSDIRDTVYTS
ncbi:hypothetical protein ASPBRDRAFT_131802 [Aspergillus brasiliensis CBS 101740]|uniref:Uncharacterized protein n=1 Tax=Aspergillus brasiliensis (strain CBS 101740 / IMI 381727 / IBT 21946) TaxID=767769 RepID=A0A1L9UB22_ASPBC|nr:hypothetical protein ASPBRDRAFT_131802 [Aspergillus brasiliensis CBS 101740]